MSDERNISNGNSEPDAPSAEDRRLEALLAGLPRRRCPERVRRNVMAALQTELEASAGRVIVLTHEAPKRGGAEVVYV